MSREAAGKSPKERAERRVGATLVKWKLDALVGIGGMAAVYAATHTKNRSRVALKVLHRELGLNHDIRERFLREAYVANTVAHPGAVQVLDDYVSEEDEPFLVMELLEGASLDAIQMSRGKLPDTDVLKYSDQILDVLAAAHDKGIVHRDIKPQNIFVTRDGRIKMLDFGVARLLDGAASATVTGSLLGTPAFMPPEQASGRTSAIGPASDLWSVGATMFTLLTGRFVHEAENAQAHTVKAAVMHARSLRELLPSAPSALALVVDRALKFEITDRWPDARTMRGAVQRARGRAAPNISEAKPDETAETATRPAPLAPRAAPADVDLAQLPLMGIDSVDSEDEETHAMARGDLRAMIGQLEGNAAPKTAPLDEEAETPREAAALLEQGPSENKEPSIDELDGATTSVLDLKRVPVVPAHDEVADNVATSVVVVPPPVFRDARTADLPAPPPPKTAASKPLGSTEPLQFNVAPRLPWQNTPEGAATTAPFPSGPGASPARQSFPGSVALVPPPPPSNPGSAAPSQSYPGSVALVPSGPPNPGAAAPTQSYPGSVALVPPPPATSSGRPVGSPRFDFPAPPQPLPEATSVSAQSISQATSPNQRKKGLGTPEMLAIAGGVVAILVVIIVVVRAIFSGPSSDNAANSAAPGLTLDNPTSASSTAVSADPSGATVTTSAPTGNTSSSSMTTDPPSPSVTASASATAKVPFQAPVDPAGRRWKPKKP